MVSSPDAIVRVELDVEGAVEPASIFGGHPERVALFLILLYSAASAASRICLGAKRRV
jgi:hypothetical protein